MNFCYKFPVVKGIQAGREYFIAMVPLKMLGRLFPADEEYVLPEYRAQRKLNESRIPEIKRYIINNPDSYVFSALAASIDGEFRYISSDNPDTGVLEVNMDAKFLINDGQHRKAAILAAIEENENLGEETISVVFYEDRGLSRSQQMFTDLNKHAVKTSNSIAELYDSRDPLAVTTRLVISSIPFLNEYVDKEKDNLGKFSSALFTLNTFYTANKRILRRNECNKQFEKFLIDFWGTIVDNMSPWNDIKNKEISKRELREHYIATQAVVIQAFGRIGAYLFEHPEYSLNQYLPQISKINWKRNSDDWKLRVIRSNGRMINNADAIILAGNVIKQHINLPLTDDEITAEQKFTKNKL
ncbi:DNA sulfur modification protein DndB [Blautia massiliensis (ex Liu et al. 2021)]|uniref:DNA sulfur modification protein DndB n=1 Tax=Blautia massiliensis (ex Liu et al. 2021) TaxID=3062492 RepID=UPI003F89D2F1